MGSERTRFDAEAVGRIFAAKNRPASSPLIVHVSNLAMARSIASEWPAIADQLAKRFWPGPLTLVVKKHRGDSGPGERGPGLCRDPDAVSPGRARTDSPVGCTDCCSKREPLHADFADDR